MKTKKNGPQKLLIIGPKLFFTVLPGCPNQPRIDFSYYKYVPRLFCLLICGTYSSGKSQIFNFSYINNTALLKFFIVQELKIQFLDKEDFMT